jgi:hypothetical protein
MIIIFIPQLYSALPLPSVMIEKSSIKLNQESVQSVLNTVLPCVLTRTNLNQGIQVGKLISEGFIYCQLISFIKQNVPRQNIGFR